ncbi:Membrane protein, suppressor for copper-sensitivity ScsD [hydrothermal vent metagenome]|uniref:Membrane protein, suppressor for copper-sensitivity ScsD n=1 Tax=hydrothermal vent metagenome TaxID=652676 RepID=A0A1W1CAC7_9ZZZZ
MGVTTIKKIIKELLVAVVILGVVSNIVSYMRKPDIKDDSLSTLIAKDIDGKLIDISSYSGKPILIHFWATWCPVCKMELSNIDRVSKRYQVVTIAVKSGSDAKIREFMSEHQANFKVINDSSGEISSKFDVEVFPTTLIYDSKGELSFSEVGYTTTGGLIARVLWAEKRQ